MFRRKAVHAAFASLAILALGAIPVQAQASCADLTVTVDANAETITFDVVGSFPDAQTHVAVGQTPGTTEINLPFVSFELGLAKPFVPVFLGATDSAGMLSKTFYFPGAGSIGEQLFAQTVTFDVDFGPGGIQVNTCLSDVESFTI